ncbi:class I SAM-dependent methyltransferase [Propionivibrio sp.]|uniref:class I SAM-dependent methyltransferase n=1 Tax=Propionivibrio sp. TaxID=2212460 RepID=UPI003BF00738
MRNFLTAKTKIVDYPFRWLRAIYYVYLFGRTFPFKGQIEKTVHQWEMQQMKGDVPKAREEWDTQFRNRQWVYMEHLDEFSRYAVIAGYIAYLKPWRAVLDVGCGEGVLFERYRPYGYTRYVGIDISQVAIAKLMPQQNTQTAFLQIDAEAYQPEEVFDAIVFNEVHYYFHDPLNTIARYCQALNVGGVLILSTYTASRRALAILRYLKAHYVVVDETMITQGAKSWFCTILKPSSAPASTI